MAETVTAEETQMLYEEENGAIVCARHLPLSMAHGDAALTEVESWTWAVYVAHLYGPETSPCEYCRAGVHFFRPETEGETFCTCRPEDSE